MPEKFRSSVFTVFVGPSTARLSMVIAPGKLTGVEGLMATAFQLEFVIITDCELSGEMPSDHDDESSQLPLIGFTQELTCAKTDMDTNATTDATKHNAALTPAVRYIRAS